MTDKEPKRVTAQQETGMGELARTMVARLAWHYPQAREIDLLNAFTREFTRRVRTALANGRVEPDYEAAAKFHYDPDDEGWWERLSDRGREIRIEETKRIVTDAIGDKLLIDPPTEEERRCDWCGDISGNLIEAFSGDRVCKHCIDRQAVDTEQER